MIIYLDYQVAKKVWGVIIVCLERTGFEEFVTRIIFPNYMPTAYIPITAISELKHPAFSPLDSLSLGLSVDSFSQTCTMHLNSFSIRHFNNETLFL